MTTYIAEKAFAIFRIIGIAVFGSSQNLQNQNAETENVRPDRELAMLHILWCHVSTAVELRSVKRHKEELLL